MGQPGRILLIENLRHLLHIVECAPVICGFNFIEIGAQFLHLSIKSDRELLMLIVDVDVEPQL